MNRHIRRIEWIPVEEAKPDGCGFVMVTLRGENSLGGADRRTRQWVKEGRYSDGEWVILDSRSFWKFFVVTHWGYLEPAE